MRILMISKKDTHCGVADYGRRVYDILASELNILLREVKDVIGYAEEVSKIRPDIILYNYHHATLSFINDTLISPLRNIKHAAIFHEGPLNFTPDKVLTTEIRPLFEGVEFAEYPLPKVGDFAFDERGNKSKIKQVDFEGWNPNLGDVYVAVCETGYFANLHTPVIGSFGFGFPDKDFTRVCREVMNQYDKAIVRLLIPFAYYGDRDGALAKDQARRCAELLKGTNIRLDVLHEYLPPLSLLHWLNQNDLNLFLYKQSNGRGIASATDYALSVNKPIGVSNSEMFRHLPKEICIDNTPLKELTVDMLKYTKMNNSNENLIAYYKRALCL